MAKEYTWLAKKIQNGVGKGGEYLEVFEQREDKRRKKADEGKKEGRKGKVGKLARTDGNTRTKE